MQWLENALVDRLAEHRTAEGMAALCADPSSRVLEVDSAGRVAADEVGLVWRPAAADDPAGLLLLGRPTRGDEPRGALLAAVREQSDPSGRRPLREVGPALAADDLEAALTAVALASWHRRDGFCGACGQATQQEPGGFSRRCPSCGALHFPRQDPAMIVAVVDAADRLLIAHQGGWADGRYSVLAGFVEAGESLEHAVRREVMEESGLHVTDVRYLVSQPWPFPRSLMCAFVARADGDPVPDGVEIVDARFVTRDEYRAALEDGSITTPAGSVSVSGWLLDSWLQGSLPSPC